MQCLWPFTRHGWTPLRGVIGVIIVLILLAWIFAYLANAPLKLAATSLIAQALLFYRIEDQGARDHTRLMGRLNGYSSLSRQPAHQILLGTLKKVETKATSLAAILVFIAIALVTVGASPFTTAPRTSSALWIAAALLSLMPSFLALLFAIRQWITSTSRLNITPIHFEQT